MSMNELCNTIASLGFLTGNENTEERGPCELDKETPIALMCPARDDVRSMENKTFKLFC